MDNTCNDKFAASLGFEILERRDGFVRVLARPDENSLNGVGVVHGGYTYSLADYAFALVTNTAERIALSSGAFINYIEAVPPRTNLVATASINAQTTKSGICDVSISDEKGEKVFAVFQARAVYKPVK